MRRPLFALLFLVACSSESDAPRGLPLAEAEHVRGLSFLHVPPVVTRTKDWYAEQVQARLSDEDLSEYKTIWGRMGYLPTDFDMRGSVKADVSRVGAYYEAEDGGRITQFAEHEDQPAILVHELVHALQDQHFDLVAHDEAVKTTDEHLAVRALVEGDASVAELRYRIEAQKQDPLFVAPATITSARAKEQSERFLDTEGVPAFLSAYGSFTYTYGAVFVAKAIGLHDNPARWSTEASDALFRGGAPASSEAILRIALGWEVDPIVDVGLVKMPEELAERWVIRNTDRLGAWFSWILLREAGEQFFDSALDWDGDQLVVIGDRDPAHPIAGIVWTSAWETEARAVSVADDLHRLHAATAESMVIDRRGVEVVFAKGTLPMEDVRVLASAALYEKKDGPRPASRSIVSHASRFFRDHSTQMATSSTSTRHGVSPPSR